MPKTFALAPITDPASGALLAAGSEIELDDDSYAALRAQGAVAASQEEQQANRQSAGPEGVYNARTTREDVTSVTPQAAPPAEQPTKK